MNTDANIDPSDDDNDPESVPNLRKHAKELEKKVKRTDELEAKLKEYETREMLRESGLSLTDKQFKALSATHDGESTSEAWKKTAEELGFHKPQTEAQEVPKAVEEGHQRLAEATNWNIGQSVTPDENPYAGAHSKDDVVRIAASLGHLADDN